MARIARMQGRTLAEPDTEAHASRKQGRFGPSGRTFMDSAVQPAPKGVWRWMPLRFLVLAIIMVVVVGAGETGLILGRDQIPEQFREPAIVVATLFACIVWIYVYRLFVRWLEKRDAAEMSYVRGMSGIIGGAIIGFLLFCAIYGVFWALGIVSFGGLDTTDGLLAALSISLMSGVGEELIFRGVVYRLVEESFGTLIALIISGAIFGLVHLGNANATLFSGAAIALEAGVLLGAAYSMTRSLWLPIGLHIAWNFTEGGIFGAAISGGNVRGLIKAPLHGPDLLTGGGFGPEASIITISVCLLLAVLMLIVAARRGEWVPLRFRLRAA